MSHRTGLAAMFVGTALIITAVCAPISIVVAAVLGVIGGLCFVVGSLADHTSENRKCNNTPKTETTYSDNDVAEELSTRVEVAKGSNEQDNYFANELDNESLNTEEVSRG